MKPLYRIIVFAVVVTLASFTSLAQKGGDRARWDGEMKKFRNEYFTRELNLTSGQQTQFFALYDAMQAERDAVKDAITHLEKEIEAKGAAATSADYNRIVELQYTRRAREAAIEAKYYEPLKKVLSWRQLYKLKKAEREYRRMLRKHARHDR